MKKFGVSALLAVAVFAVTAPVFAHHGFAGRYDEDHPYTVQGTVLELQFMNPHSIIIFEAKDEKGKVERWQAELGSANQLHMADGWDKNTLKPGDKITITGPRAKNGAPDMNLSHESLIVRTDNGQKLHDSMGNGSKRAPIDGAGTAGQY